MRYWTRKPWGDNRPSCPKQKTYPVDRLGRMLLIAGVVVFFLFAPFWIWVVGLGVLFIALGVSMIHSG